MTTNPISARRPVSPHIILNEMLDERGWTTEQLAEKSCLKLDVCTALILGDAKINRFSAMGLSIAFGTSSEFWRNLQDNHDNWEPPCSSSTPS